MQKVGAVKTKLAHKPVPVSFCLIVFAVLATSWLGQMNATNIRTLKTNRQLYSLKISNTPESRNLGLGGRKSLPHSEGMLFVFDTQAVRCFWMKDMRFDIDIIWADSHKKVVHVVHGATPESYPKMYCPQSLAAYVIELNAGEAKKAGITTGDQLDLRL